MHLRWLWNVYEIRSSPPHPKKNVAFTAAFISIDRRYFTLLRDLWSENLQIQKINPPRITPHHRLAVPRSRFATASFADSGVLNDNLQTGP